MSGAKWTPGPYAVRESFTSNYLFEITARSPSGKPAVVARISGPPFAQYREGTAALLAAAPDLYDALAGLLDRFDQRGFPVDSEHPDRIAVERARAALSRAAGSEGGHG